VASVAARATPRPARGLTRRHRRSLIAFLLVLPALAFFAVFYLGPSLTGVFLSLHEWDGVSSRMTFVGLDNYVRLLETPRFWSSLAVNWIVALTSVAIQIPLGLGLALLLTRRSRATSAYRSALFLPQVLSVAAVGVMFVLIYDPYNGLLNSLVSTVAGWFGGGPVTLAWLGENDTALLSAIVAATWYGVGLTMILFLAGVGSIPPEYTDAARLETNSTLVRLRYITIPMLREVMLIIFVLIVSGSFGQLIGFFMLLTNGGPANRTELLGLYMLDAGMRGYQFGYASAISVVLVLIVLAVVIVPVLRISRERLEF
jgi:raffinose/stachyose/melibiose transport system permease protein